MQISLLIGLGAGLVSAVLFASASTGTLLGLLVLFFLSPVPVAIAGLGWGWMSATAAAATGALAVGLIGGPRTAMFHVIAIGAPAAVAAYLLLLSRPGADPAGAGGSAVEWYPIGRVIALASVWAGALTAVGLLATASDIDGLRAQLQATFGRMFEAGGLTPGGGRALTEAEIKSFVELMVVMLPWAIATLWMVIAALNLWIAGHVTRVSGRLVRPWPDLSSLSLPPAMPPAFALAVALTFLPGMSGLLASGFASAILFAYMLVGLAILHSITRGLSVRPVILTMVYAALAFLSPFSSLIVALLGLAEPIWRRRQPPANPPTS